MMGTWNYRIVRYADGTGYGLHEVHYDADGTATSMTAFPASVTGDTPDDIRADLVMMRHDASERPVFDQPAEWARRCKPTSDPLTLAFCRLADAADRGCYAAQLGSTKRLKELVEAASAALADVERLMAAGDK